MSIRGLEIALVRHGQSTGNGSGRVLGHEMTPPLTATGRSQARGAAERLATWGATDLWSSDMARAVQTAHVIGDRLRLPLRTTALLREQDHGRLDGLVASEMAAIVTPPGSDITEIRWGGGESVADVYARLRRFMGVIAGGDGRRLIVVGHSDMACALSSMLAGLGHRQVGWNRLAHGEVRELHWDGRQILPA